MAESRSGRVPDQGPDDAPSELSEPRRTVLLLGDHEFVVDALNLVFRSRDIGIRFLRADQAHAAGAARLEHPDVVLIDLAMRGGDVVALLNTLRDAQPGLLALALESDEGESTPEVVAAFDGKISKGASLDELADAILDVEKQTSPGGAAPTDVDVDERYDEKAFARAVAAELTFREHEVLALLVLGASSNEIAKELNIKHNTLRTHVQNVLTKLQVHTRLQAVMFAVRNGLVSVPREGFGSSPDSE